MNVLVIRSKQRWIFISVLRCKKAEEELTVKNAKEREKRILKHYVCFRFISSS